MQLQDMVGSVRKTLGEVEIGGYGTQPDGQGTWDNSQIIGYINEAVGLISHLIQSQGSAPVTLNPNTNVYPLPTDCLEDGVRKLVYNAGGALGPVPVTPLSLDEFEKIMTNPPNTIGGILFSYYYTVWANSLMLMPYPQKASDTATLFYFKTLGTLVLPGDTPIGLPARFHIGPVFYAIARCQQAVEETGLYQLAFGQWQQIEGQLRAEMSRKSRDRNRVRPR